MAKSNNRYDVLVEKLQEEFSKIPNFNLLSTDEKGKSIFDFVVKRNAEIIAFKTLFTNYYLPAASKAVVDDLQEISKSKYKHSLNLTKEDLKENYHETIRLGYIGMFHKYESYVNDLFKNGELLISDLNENNTKLEPFLKDTFKYDIRQWYKSKNIGHINWISNSNKHNDGYPIVKFAPIKYANCIDTEKLKLTREDFVADIALLVEHYKFSLQVIFNVAIYKMLIVDVVGADPIEDIELRTKFEVGQEEMKKNIKSLLELM
jgi:hypothetical protein